MTVNKIDKADALLYNHIKQNIQPEADKPYNPFDEQRLRQLDKQEEQNRLFKLDDAVGDLLGWMYRGWLVAFLAPKKRGKSWWLVEMVWHALNANLKVYVVNAEMSAFDYDKRVAQRVTGFPMKTGVDLHIRRFSCALYDRCNYKRKAAKEPCTACKDWKRTRFEPIVYYGEKDKDKPVFSSSAIINRLNSGGWLWR